MGSSADDRILILAPTGRDALMTANFLKEAGLFPEICADVEQLCQKISDKTGLVFLTAEVLSTETLPVLTASTLR